MGQQNTDRVACCCSARLASPGPLARSFPRKQCRTSNELPPISGDFMPFLLDSHHLACVSYKIARNVDGSVTFMQASEAIQAAFSRSSKQLVEGSQHLLSAVVSELSERCAAGLSQLRGITAMYRMSARPAPTRSHFLLFPLLLSES